MTTTSTTTAGTVRDCAKAALLAVKKEATFPSFGCCMYAPLGVCVCSSDRRCHCSMPMHRNVILLTIVCVCVCVPVAFETLLVTDPLNCSTAVIRLDALYSKCYRMHTPFTVYLFFWMQSWTEIIKIWTKEGEKQFSIQTQFSLLVSWIFPFSVRYALLCHVAYTFFQVC